MNSSTEDLSIILAAAAQERVTHVPSTHIYERFISHKMANLTSGDPELWTWRLKVLVTIWTQDLPRGIQGR